MGAVIKDNVFNEFQFLHGTIKSYEIPITDTIVNAFQFLHGTIKSNVQYKYMQYIVQCFNSFMVQLKERK